MSHAPSSPHPRTNRKARSSNNMGSSLYELFGDFKQRRKSIPREALAIGEYRRRPRHVGRPVTQGELAEAIGISREWYCSIENGKCPEASPELLRKITMALHDRRKARQVQWEYDQALVASLADLRHYIKRVSAAASYANAAREAIETGARLLGTPCVSVINLENDDGQPPGYAVGPQARFWSAVCDRVVRDAHGVLRNGGVGINEHLPAADDIGANPSVVVTFERTSDSDDDYEYECSSDVWREFTADLGVRSVIVAPLRDRDGFRGTAAFWWAEPRKIEQREIELVQTLTSVLELIA
jgi:DNA-binding XRE family transcriptional regulator